MNKLGDIELFQCKYVSDLFAYSAKRKDCSSKVFVKAYAYSSVARRVSSKSFIMEALDITSAYEIIKNEKKINRRGVTYPSYVMAWIGYIMQYFECATSIPFTAIYKRIKPEELFALYESYHSLDNDLAIKRIAEAKNINIELNSFEIMKSLS